MKPREPRSKSPWGGRKKIGVALLMGVAALAAACSQRVEPNGLGPYRFGHTTAGSIRSGNCRPDTARDGRKIIWCMALPPIKVGARAADVDAYFLLAPPYTEKTAPLIEVLVSVRGCVEDEVVQWMRERFGPPAENKATRVYWQNSFVWAAAFVPSEPGRCLIHVLPRGESAEIERLKAE